MSTRAKLRWPLLAAMAAALVVASVGGASHGGGVDAVALHLGFTNSVNASTTHNCTSTASCLRVDNLSTGNGSRAIRASTRRRAARRRRSRASRPRRPTPLWGSSAR